LNLKYNLCLLPKFAGCDEPSLNFWVECEADKGRGQGGLGVSTTMRLGTEKILQHIALKLFRMLYRLEENLRLC